MWGGVWGGGLALFAGRTPPFVLGAERAFAIPAFQNTGLAAALSPRGFNWGAFYKARNNTRPIAIAGVTMMVAVMVLAIPLTYSHGVRGYALGMALATAILILMRCYWLARLFPTVALFSHAVRAMWPTVPATIAVLAIRAADSGPRSAATAAGEAAVFVIVLAIGVFFAERRLMREVLGYLRRGTVSGSAA